MVDMIPRALEMDVHMDRHLDGTEGDLVMGWKCISPDNPNVNTSRYFYVGNTRLGAYSQSNGYQWVKLGVYFAQGMAHSSSDYDQVSAAALFNWIYDNGLTTSNSVRYANGMFSTGGAHGFIGYIYSNKKYGALLMFSYGALRFWRLDNGNYVYKDLI